MDYKQFIQQTEQRFEQEINKCQCTLERLQLSPAKDSVLYEKQRMKNQIAQLQTALKQFKQTNNETE